MSDLTKDEAANLDWALMALAKNAGYVLPSEKATAIQEVLETQEKRIAALERENSELRELCRIASGPLAELNKIRLQSEPRALPDAVCLSCGEKINWVDQPCMRASSETIDDPLASVRWVCKQCNTVNDIANVKCLGCKQPKNTLPARCSCGAYEWPPNCAQIEDSRGSLHWLNDGCSVIPPQNTNQHRE